MNKFVLALVAMAIIAMAVVPVGVASADGITPTYSTYNTPTGRNLLNVQNWVWTIPLTSKDSSTWAVTDDMKATVTIRHMSVTALATRIPSYYRSCIREAYFIGLSATGLQPKTSYSIIYYADPWAGQGGRELLRFTTNRHGTAQIMPNKLLSSWQSIPCEGDKNEGGKIWIVPASDYSGGQMTAWNPANYLFETALVNIP